MKVSLNWVKQYTDVNVSVDELVQKVGAQLGEIEGVENLGEKYRGIVIVKIVACVDHPDSDHMHVCKIDDGGKVQNVERDADGYVTVVCGAPNVREGLLVAWLPPGSTVPESVGKEPFVLGARELRGVISNGMLASPRELALGDSHEGILEIDPTEWSPNQKDIKPGADFAEVFGLNDYVIDIENKMFTHRPDCFGILGVAREIAGILGQQFTSPDWYGTVGTFPEGSGLELTVTNEAPELVPRLMALTMKNVSVKPSPLWLQCQLVAVGQKPINNIVDVTNYIMLLTAQPTHAYDYDKLRGHALIARTAKPGETITLLNHKTYELNPNDLVIADGEGPIGLAGIMGGGDSEVSDDTKNIVLECASFDMYTVRRSSMRHGVFTDALTRFNKGQSPLQNDHVLHLLMQSVQDVAGGEVAGPVADKNHLEGRQWVHPPVPLTAEFINARLGLSLTADDVKTLLENVECTVAVVGEEITVTAPFWRTDIETREDVVEEVGRLYGYDKLPLVLPTRSVKPVDKDPMFELKSRVREQLSKAGANEALTYSFVHGNLLEKVGQSPEHAYALSNALSPDLQYYRLSLTASLLDKIHPNIKAGYDEFVLFEMGKGHNLNQIDPATGLPAEFEMLEVIYASNRQPASGAAFYTAKTYLENLIGHFGPSLEYRPIEKEEDYPVVKPYDHTRSAQIFFAGTDTPLGMIGEYKQSVTRNLKLPKYVAGFGIGLMQLQQNIPQFGTSYQPLPRFPKVSQDITLKVAAEHTFAGVYEVVDRGFSMHMIDDTHNKLEALGIYQKEPDYKQYTFRITCTGLNRTLTEQEVSGVLEGIAGYAAQELKAERL